MRAPPACALDLEPRPCLPGLLAQPAAVHRRGSGATARAQGQVSCCLHCSILGCTFTVAASVPNSFLPAEPCVVARPCLSQLLCLHGSQVVSHHCSLSAEAAGGSRACSTDSSSAPACLARLQDRGVGGGAAQQAHAELNMRRRGCCQRLHPVSARLHWPCGPSPLLSPGRLQEQGSASLLLVTVGNASKAMRS